MISRAGLERVASVFLGINPFAFVFAVLIYVFSLFVSTLRLRLLLAEDFGLLRLFSLYLVGSFFNIFLPGIVGGDAVKAYYLYKESGRAGRTIASVFMDRYIGFVALVSIGIAAFPFGLRYFKGSWIEWALPLVVILFTLFSVTFFGLRLGSHLRPLREFYGHFQTYVKRKSLILKALLVSFFVQGLIILSVYVLSVGLGMDIPPLVFLMFFPVIVTVSSLPISISGMGLREASFVLLFGLVGVSPETSTALSLSWFLSMSAGSLPGLLVYIRRKDDKIPHEWKNP